jgi:hypothetical protein
MSADESFSTASDSNDVVGSEWEWRLEDQSEDSNYDMDYEWDCLEGELATSGIDRRSIRLLKTILFTFANEPDGSANIVWDDSSMTTILIHWNEPWPWTNIQCVIDSADVLRPFTVYDTMGPTRPGHFLTATTHTHPNGKVTTMKKELKRNNVIPYIRSLVADYTYIAAQ